MTTSILDSEDLLKSFPGKMLFLPPRRRKKSPRTNRSRCKISSRERRSFSLQKRARRSHAASKKAASRPMIECMVDSTTLIDALRGWQLPPDISSRFSRACISHVALGELLLGVLKSTNPKELERTVRLIKGMKVIHGDGETAVTYAGLRRDLENRGTMIPQNDIWIAASALQMNVPLISRDQHFRHISQLQMVSY